MSTAQKQLRIADLKPGDVVVKGNHERIVKGFDGIIVVYQSKTDIRKNRVTGVRIDVFAKWLDGAKMKNEVTQ